MNIPTKNGFPTVCAGASIALLGLALAGCSSNEATPMAAVAVTETAPATAVPDATSAASTPAPSKESASVPDERKVVLEVKGVKSSAWVKTLVITADGKKTEGKMVQETLPFAQDLPFPADTTFLKILVLGKYADGAEGDISCSIMVDGRSVSGSSSAGHRPAECLFVGKGSGE